MSQTNQSNTGKSGITRRRFLQQSAAIMGGFALQRSWAGAAALRLGRAFQGGTAINVMDPASCAKGDGTTNDRDAFQAAIDAAVDAGVRRHGPQAGVTRGRTAPYAVAGRFFRRSTNCRRNFAIFGATTPWQYGWPALVEK